MRKFVWFIILCVMGVVMAGSMRDRAIIPSTKVASTSAASSQATADDLIWDTCIRHANDEYNKFIAAHGTADQANSGFTPAEYKKLMIGMVAGSCHNAQTVRIVR